MNKSKLYLTAKWTAKAFAQGVASGASDGTIMGTAVLLGVGQGLKYKGSFNRGLVTGLSIYGILSVGVGITTTIKNIDVIANNVRTEHAQSILDKLNGVIEVKI